MNPWRSSPLYLAWVIGGLIAIVAFAILKGLSDPTDQSVIFWLIPMLALYMGGILLMQFRQANRVERDHPEAAAGSTGIVKWNIVFAAVLCTAIFTGVAAFYAGVDAAFYPVGDGGPGFPAVLLPAILLVLVGAAKAMGVLRAIRRGEMPGKE
jgi:peptidoglycan/LPS O-acetylase OafA/YrhL